MPWPFPARQRGAALLLGMLVLFMAALAGLFWNLSRLNYVAERDKTTAAALARAKEALIAAAASVDLSSGSPGELPCPASDDNGYAAPNCSTQASRIGRLPWRTLGLPDLRDSSGEILWYALSSNYRKNGPVINSGTLGTITVRDVQGAPIFDATAGTGAVAVLIAPGAPLARPTSVSDATPYTQARSGGGTNAAINYLDLANGEDNSDFADNGANGFTSGPVRDAGGNLVSNDQVLAIGHDELMAAVERRVAREVKACIELHADSTVNASHRFPWPAPLSVTDYKGKAGSYFGAIPTTQPGINPQAVVQQTLADLNNARTAVTSATTATDQLAAVQALATLTESAKQFFYWLHLAVKDISYAGLVPRAIDTRSAATTLDNTVDNALTNNSLNATEKKNIKNAASSLQSDIDALQLALTDTGIDAFPPELALRSADFQQALNAATNSTPTQSRFATLKSKADAISQLLAATSTQNSAIGTGMYAVLTASQQASSSSAAATADPSNQALVSAALSSGNALMAATTSLQATISSYRVNVSASVIDGYAARVNATAAQLSATPSNELASLLATREQDLKAVVDSITTGSPAIVSSRNAASAALSAALSAAGATSSNYSQAVSAAADAIAASTVLSASIQNNGDNLTQTSLAATASTFGISRAAFESTSTATNATALQNAGNLIYFWADIVTRQATSIALLSSESTSPISAFKAASNTSAGINDSSGSAAALEAYIASPGDSQLQAQASARLATTVNQLDTLISSTGNLLGTLSSSTANAFPLTWLSPTGHCDFLNATTGSTWWKDNGWSAYVFYQIGDVLGTTPGALKVNGTGAYRVVVIVAGRPLSGQNRATRTTANYFEDINADPTRDGDAVNPIQTFVDRVFSTTFNDRLAY